MTDTATSNPPFKRLLSYFAQKSNPPSRDTLTFWGSMRGDLAIGLNAPIALVLASIRHLVFSNTGLFSLRVYIPTLRTSRLLLGGPGAFNIEESRRYTRQELTDLAGTTDKGGLTAKLDAIGLWMLAASSTDGTVSGHEVRLFQRGEIMEHLEKRRTDKSDVLPFWRGGPLWVAGHSWAVKRCFDIDVYRER